MVYSCDSIDYHPSEIDESVDFGDVMNLNSGLAHAVAYQGDTSSIEQVLKNNTKRSILNTQMKFNKMNPSASSGSGDAQSPSTTSLGKVN